MKNAFLESFMLKTTQFLKIFKKKRYFGVKRCTGTASRHRWRCNDARLLSRRLGLWLYFPVAINCYGPHRHRCTHLRVGYSFSSFLRYVEYTLELLSSRCIFCMYGVFKKSTPIQSCNYNILDKVHKKINNKKGFSLILVR